MGRAPVNTVHYHSLTLLHLLKYINEVSEHLLKCKHIIQICHLEVAENPMTGWLFIKCERLKISVLQIFFFLLRLKVAYLDNIFGIQVGE